MDLLTLVPRLLVGLGLTAFMPFTASSFFRFRLAKKAADFERIVKVLDLRQESGRARLPLDTATDTYSARGFILPVAFVTLLCLVGFSYLLFGAELLADGAGSLLLGGTPSLAGLEKAAAGRRLSLLVMVIAFTSAYIWSCQNVFRRLITGDLAPGTYYSAGLRMVFAPLIALLISWLPGADTYGLDTLPVVAFLTGLFPEWGLDYLRRRVSFFSSDKARADELSCDQIEGLNAFHKLRLAEVGVDNAQNLAAASLVDLLLRTPFQAAQLIDWIAQAKLYVLAKGEIEALRRLGIRTIFELGDLCADAKLMQRVTAETDLPPLFLEIACRSAADDEEVHRLRRFRERLAGLAGEGEEAPEAGGE